MSFRRLALTAALLFAALSPASAQWLGVVDRHQSVKTSALDHPLVFTAYRPAMDPPSGVRWPTIYLLEGRPGLSDWFDQGSVHEVIDRAIADGVIPPSLVVTVAAPFSWYVDNPAPDGQGKVATAIVRDLIAAVDARYPTAACREGRVIGGLSMGGYGAVLLGLTRPDSYVAAMSFAGAISPPIDALDTGRAARADPFYDGAFGRPLNRERFNEATVFAKLREARDRLGPKPAMFLAAGDEDRGGLLLSTTRFYVELKRAGFDAALRIGPGLHDWPTWRSQLAEGLAWVGPKLDPSCGREIARAGSGRAEDVTK